jgi:hypothetical protein
VNVFASRFPLSALRSGGCYFSVPATHPRDM